MQNLGWISWHRPNLHFTLETSVAAMTRRNCSHEKSSDPSRYAAAAQDSAKNISRARNSFQSKSLVMLGGSAWWWWRWLKIKSEATRNLRRAHLHTWDTCCDAKSKMARNRKDEIDCPTLLSRDKWLPPWMNMTMKNVRNLIYFCYIFRSSSPFRFPRRGAKRMLFNAKHKVIFDDKRGIFPAVFFFSAFLADEELKTKTKILCFIAKAIWHNKTETLAPTAASLSEEK